MSFPTPSALHAEARRLMDRFGWCVLPMKLKKPALRAWKQFQRRLPNEKELFDGFINDDVTGLGVVAGPVSNDLVVRDFDKATKYKRWATANPVLAKSLPTSGTGRGFHVMFRSPEIRRISHLGDGELRGAGYSLLPGSLHPNGTFYEWLIPPGPKIPVLDDYRSLVPNAPGEPRKPPLTIACVSDAISATLPTGPGERNRCVFDLARHLKAMLGSDAAESELRSIVSDWHRLALPVIRTKPFAVTWTDFREAWRNVRRAPVNLGSIASEVRRELGEVEAIVFLDALCLRLQAAWGTQPFFLGFRKAAELAGVPLTAAFRAMLLLEESGKLRRVATGELRTNRATTWHYYES